MWEGTGGFVGVCLEGQGARVHRAWQVNVGVLERNVCARTQMGLVWVVMSEKGAGLRLTSLPDCVPQTCLGCAILDPGSVHFHCLPCLHGVTSRSMA